MTDEELKPYYEERESLRSKIITENQLPTEIRYVAGADVVYSEVLDRMIGAIAVIDLQTLNVVDKMTHQMEVELPYTPGLYSFREVAPLIEAYKQLKQKPDLIICHAKGIAHPEGLWAASHLGIELGVAAVGCSKELIVGAYDERELGPYRGKSVDIVHNGEVVGKAVRTQDQAPPVFVTQGHRISLDLAVECILDITPEFRLPEAIRQAEQSVDMLMTIMKS